MNPCPFRAAPKSKSRVFTQALKPRPSDALNSVFHQPARLVNGRRLLVASRKPLGRLRSFGIIPVRYLPEGCRQKERRYFTRRLAHFACDYRLGHGNVKVGWVRRWVRSRGDLAAIPKGIDDSEDHHLCRPIGLATTGAIRRRADLAYWGVRKEPCLVCPARRERVGDLAPAANPARCRSWLPGFLLGSVRGWDFGPRGWGRRNPRKGEPSPNGLIEIAALGGRAQQGFVHFPGNAQILIESSTEKFQLQHLAGFVVDNRREGGRLYGGNAHARFLLGRVARKSPSGRRGRASVRDAAGGARRCAVLRRCSLPRPDATS